MSINVSPEKGMQKTPVEQAVFLESMGIEGDAHAGPGNRQVSLLSLSSIEKQNRLLKNKKTLKAGDFAENLTVSGITVMELPLGTRLKIGDAVVLKITKIGKECPKPCKIYYLTGMCVMPEEGVFASVETGGIARTNDVVEVMA